MNATSKEKVRVVTAGDILDDLMPVRFNIVSVDYDALTDRMSYYLATCSLTSLQRRDKWPSKIDVFGVAQNLLTSLEHGPTVAHTYYCHKNKLTSLRHGPTSVCYFDCSENLIASLDGAPRVIEESFICNFNMLTSLKGIHEQIDYVYRFSAENNPITSHVLGLMLIDGLKTVTLDNKKVQEILNRHLGKGRVGMLMAQEELIEAGLDEYAQL